jgi:DNA-directed RNA polymerase specialized sigma24 family protein
MSNQDDALPLPRPRSAKGPTPEELQAHLSQHAWLEECINWQAMRRRARRDTRDATVADEIVQDLHNDMLQWTLEELQGLQSPGGYANKALTHRLLNWRRQASRTTSLQDNFDTTADSAMSFEELWEVRDEAVKLLGELPSEWVAPLVMCKAYEYTAEETALKLNLTANIVKKRVVRAMHYLRLKAAVPDHSLVSRVKNFIRRKEHRND